MERNSKESINYLKTNISMQSDNVSRQVIETLKSRDLVARMFDWKFDQLPLDDKKKVDIVSCFVKSFKLSGSTGT